MHMIPVLVLQSRKGVNERVNDNRERVYAHASTCAFKHFFIAQCRTLPVECERKAIVRIQHSISRKWNRLLWVNHSG